MDTTKPITHISLCAGYGGIDLGLKRAIPGLRTVAFSEIEAFACANLVAKMEAGFLDPAPIWTNLKTFPWHQFRGKVDILSGGYPCQPFSAAGKRLGKDDPRHLWPWIADGISILQPALCFFENVEGHISLGLSTVVSDLEGLGYKVAFGLFSASEVGAPHQRKRIFVLAHRNDAGLERYDQLLAGCRQPRWESSEQAGHIIGGNYSSEAMADAASGRSKGLSDGNAESAYAFPCGPWPSRPGQPQFPWEPPRVVVNSTRNESQQRESGELEETERPRESSNDAATDAGSIVGNTSQLQRDGSNDNGGNGKRSEAVSESGNTSWQSMGNASQYDGGHLSERHRAFGSKQSSGRQAEPSLGGDAHGAAGGMDYAKLCVSGDNRTDELRLLGNGVVPATAERAFRTLIARFFP